jgi:hypothetical protein
MVTTTSYSTYSRYQTAVGSGFDGVVRVTFGGYTGTGTLLFDGRAILTAAHLFDNGTGTASVIFETTSGRQVIDTGAIQLHPGYNATENNHDLALLWLLQPAPVAAERYTLYRANDEIGQTVTLVGYGLTGTGHTGAVNGNAAPVRLQAGNQLDADAGTLKQQLGSSMAWTPLPGSQLVADFDNGRQTNDALGQLVNRRDLGLGLYEGLIAPGDSGGPAFIGYQVAGVASYTSNLSYGATAPDIDDTANSSFGEIAAWQRVSHYQQWIDQSLRARYADAPARPEDVKKAVSEGNSGTSYVYFLLQFTGVREPDTILSVDYRTRDGTAQAGSDYLATQGTLQLYPGEHQAVVAVEIVGDTVPEPDETLYLDVFNPVGASFGEGVTQLTAMRTLVNDDDWLV